MPAGEQRGTSQSDWPSPRAGRVGTWTATLVVSAVFGAFRWRRETRISLFALGGHSYRGIACEAAGEGRPVPSSQSEPRADGFAGGNGHDG